MENMPKKYGRVLSFIPVACYAVWSLAFLITTGGHVEVSSFGAHFHWLTSILFNHGLLLWTFVMCAIIAFTVLVYYIIHVARVKSMGSGDKIVWIMFMSCFGPLAFPFFYYIELKKEPEYIDVYPDIA